LSNTGWREKATQQTETDDHGRYCDRQVVQVVGKPGQRLGCGLRGDSSPGAEYYGEEAAEERGLEADGQRCQLVARQRFGQMGGGRV
jgi:hypothetical protein